MRRKQTWDLIQTRRHLAINAMVLGSATMLTGSLEAQSLGIKRETMPEELEAAVKETVDQEVNAIITLGPVEHGQPGVPERMFVTEDRSSNPDPVTRTVNLEEYPINLEAMPEKLEAVVKDTIDEQVNAIITLAPNGQERTLLTRERFSNPDDPDTVIVQKFPIESAKRITTFFSTLSGVGYLMWESSPDCQCQYYAPDICSPVPGHAPPNC